MYNPKYLLITREYSTKFVLETILCNRYVDFNALEHEYAIINY